jgi:serpin B
MMGIQELGWIVVLIFWLGLWEVQPAFASDENPDKAIVVQGNNAFALDLYARLQSKPGNLFFCPYSIRAALTMTSAGARNNTEKQMAQVLHLNLEPQRLHPALQTWLNELNVGSGGQQGYQLQIANALWGQAGYGFRNEFLKLLQTYYGAGLREVDFANAVEAARKTMNSWVEQQTQGKISEMFKPGILSPATTLVLTNAIYFKGKWALPFDREKTVGTPFTLISGEKVEVPMMHQTATLNYFEDNDVQVLELPYAGAQLSLLFFLPRKIEQLPALEAAFSGEYLQQRAAQLREQKVMVGVPRFTLSAEFSLPKVLKTMGMTDAFTLPPADFSGMTGKQNLCISEVLHRAFVDVNEEGTEAAAATSVTMTRGFARLPSFQADHPFLLVIRDNRSQGILFLGRVMDPRG